MSRSSKTVGLLGHLADNASGREGLLRLFLRLILSQILLVVLWVILPTIYLKMALLFCSTVYCASIFIGVWQGSRTRSLFARFLIRAYFATYMLAAGGGLTILLVFRFHAV